MPALQLGRKAGLLTLLVLLPWDCAGCGGGLAPVSNHLSSMYILLINQQVTWEKVWVFPEKGIGFS
jgi:hypothetical protein